MTLDKINRINEEINDLIQLRDRLQEGCPHTDTKIIEYMWRPGAVVDTIQCKDCLKIIENNSITLIDGNLLDDHITDPPITDYSWKEEDFTIGDYEDESDKK